MRGRYPDKLTLKKKDVTILQQLLRDGRTSLRVARRAQILLTRASNQRVGQVVAKVDQHASTVWRVCERYRQRGLEAALYDAPRSGRPPVFFLDGAQTGGGLGLQAPRHRGIEHFALVDTLSGAGHQPTGECQQYGSLHDQQHLACGWPATASLSLLEDDGVG